MEYLETFSVPAIAVIVMAVMSLLKAALKNTKGIETFKLFIPIVSAVLGALLGVLQFYTASDLIAAQNVFGAMISGGASGLAATGFHQIFKQMKPDSAGGEPKTNDGESSSEPASSTPANENAQHKENDTSEIVEALSEIVKSAAKDNRNHVNKQIK